MLVEDEDGGQDNFGPTYSFTTAPRNRLRAPPIAEITHDEPISSLVDVDSPHIASVSSDYKSQAIKTDTQAERIQHEAEDLQRKTEQQAKQAEQKTKEAADKAKAKGEKAGKTMQENSDNPVVVGNAVVLGLGGAAIGYMAYQKYTAGEFTWKVGGAFAGAVGLFAVADYFVSNYFFEKYPPKK
ncbi:hypothetical protein LTS18_012420 [Coniosporium uncinatum]|uniref:Uncharacterized protein n=1 Tax=Coniosporium uncinatum TaxID=93489 RepID=A0ACC3DJ66_9PEZI|nr:hypothetical protein LTS18_012420 [Coniosporium uncinatum]